MALRTVRVDGDEVLRKKAKKVERIDANIVNLLKDMADTMYHNDGVGLAANQVGILKRMIVVDDGDGLLMLINPVITFSEGAISKEEGCLSFPEMYGDVERAKHIKVRAIDECGRKMEIEAEDLLARIIQHEVDHLDGKLFVDFSSNVHRHSKDEEDEESKEEESKEELV